MPGISRDPVNSIKQTTKANIDPAIQAAAKELWEKFGHAGTVLGTPTKNVKL